MADSELDGGKAVTQVPAGAAPLRLEQIETIPVRVPLGRTYRGSQYQMTHRSTMIGRVITEAGVVGEAYAGDEDAALANRQSSRGDRAGIAAGRVRVERCWELARPSTFDILRDRRLGLVACAGVDTAVWDAVGKALGQPLWRLWGGFRNTIPMISIGGYYWEGADIPAEVAELRERGLAGMKFKVGGLTPEEDARRFRTARDAAGPDFVLMADANQAWSPRDAIRFAQLVEDCDLYWFEEPCRWHNDARAMRDVRHAAGVRVCAGQSEFSAAGCRDLMDAGRSTSATSTRPGREARPSGGGSPRWRSPTTSRWVTTRSRRSPRTCSARSRTARSSSASTPTATRSGGT